MEIFKVIGVAIIGAICSLLLKNTSSTFSSLAVISTGIIILIIALNSLTEVVIAFEEIVDKTGVDNELFGVLMKIIGVGYLTEYSVSLCNDFDCASIGKKLAFAGKIVIFLMALPIVKSLIDLVVGMI
ncbi:MAG: SpoIIIAC/SpoIIIAD family protein [Christensenellales bacterium]